MVLDHGDNILTLLDPLSTFSGTIGKKKDTTSAQMQYSSQI